MKPFRDSPEFAFRRLVRACIRKSDLTKSEQAVTTAVVNLWFHHKAKGVVYPGRARLAKSAKVSVRTVASTLAKLRAAGVLRVVSHGKGGRAATRYRLRFTPLFILCGADLPDWMEGELRPIPMLDCTLSGDDFARFREWELHAYPVQELHTDLKDVSTGDFQPTDDGEAEDA